MCTRAWLQKILFPFSCTIGIFLPYCNIFISIKKKKSFFLKKTKEQPKKKKKLSGPHCPSQLPLHLSALLYSECLKKWKDFYILSLIPVSSSFLNLLW
jgi:hypothetical protein